MTRALPSPPHDSTQAGAAGEGGRASRPVTIGRVRLASPLAMAPMAGMTDTAFRRLVKRHGGCGLVVSEMVSSEGLVRGIDRTLAYAEFTDEERPVAVQIFGGDPRTMAEAARVVEAMGADIVDVNMGCPVPKIARNSAGCTLMREPARAAQIVAAMSRAVTIPVTVKMRAGWSEAEQNAPQLARMVADAGAAAVTVHGRTAAQSYSGRADWNLVARLAEALDIPVFGNGDCIDAQHIVDHLSSVDGVLVGRGVLRNPWVLAQASDLMAGRAPREVSLEARGRFLLDYIDLLLEPRTTQGLRSAALSGPRSGGPESPSLRHTQSPSRSLDRWVINKIRALATYYTKGFERGGSLRAEINATESVDQLRGIIGRFFARST